MSTVDFELQAWSFSDRFWTRVERLKAIWRQRVCKWVGAPDPTQVSFLVHSAKTLVRDLDYSISPVPINAHIHAARVKEAIWRVDPMLAKIAFPRRPQL